MSEPVYSTNGLLLSFKYQCLITNLHSLIITVSTNETPTTISIHLQEFDCKPSLFEKKQIPYTDEII